MKLGGFIITIIFIYGRFLKVVVWSILLQKINFFQKTLVGLQTTNYLWSLTLKLLKAQISL